MKVGLVGFSGSGKSTVFQWLTGVIPDPAKIQQGQTGMAPVPDERLAKMDAKFKPKKTRYAEIAFLDTPGLLVSERKDNARRLGILREGDGLLVVLDGFSGADLPKQLQLFREELIFADLEIVANRLEKLAVQMKKSKPAKEREQDEAETAVMNRLHQILESGKSAKTMGMRPEEEKLIRSFQLLTLKPELVFVNFGDNNPNGPIPADLLAMAPGAIGAPVKLEKELAELDEESRAMFMADLGIKDSSRDTTVRNIFYGMGRIVFFTVGHDECRSWAIDKGACAVDGAAEIHTDLAKRFVRATVVSYPDFLEADYEEKNAKAKGTFRTESKEYIVQDGDIMHIL